MSADWKNMIESLARGRVQEDRLEVKTEAKDLMRGAHVVIVTKLGRTMADGVVNDLGEDYVEILSVKTGVDQVQRFATDLYDFLVPVVDESAGSTLSEAGYALAVREADGEWSKEAFATEEDRLARAKAVWEADTEVVIRDPDGGLKGLQFDEDFNPEYVEFSPGTGPTTFGVEGPENPWANDATGAMPVTPAGLEAESRPGKLIVKKHFPTDDRYAETLWQDIGSIGMDAAAARHGLPITAYAEMAAELISAGLIKYDRPPETVPIPQIHAT